MDFREYLDEADMDFREYLDEVDSGRYPKNPRLPTDAAVYTGAGTILNVTYARGGFSSLAIIESLSGTLRSNHYHKTDWHYMHVIDGEMHYYWRSVRSNEEPRLVIVKQGETIFTPPMTEHATFFPTATRLAVVSKNVRDHVGHEADLVRTQFMVLKEGVPKLCS